MRGAQLPISAERRHTLPTPHLFGNQPAPLRPCISVSFSLRHSATLLCDDHLPQDAADVALTKYPCAHALRRAFNTPCVFCRKPHSFLRCWSAWDRLRNHANSPSLTEFREISILAVDREQGKRHTLDDIQSRPKAMCCTRANRRKATAMTIIINIKPEVQEELSRQAAAHGVDVNSYAASLLEEAAHVPAGAKKLSQAQLEKTLEEIAQFSQKIPGLPDEAFTRESLYRDHEECRAEGRV